MGELDRQFNAMHGDIGPVPNELKSVMENMQQRIQKIKGIAPARPVDPVTATLMQRFVGDISAEARSKAKDAEPIEESGSGSV